MSTISSKSQPLLRGTASDGDMQQRYDSISNHVSVKSLDEEYLVANSDSSTSTVNVHDPDYIVNNRLGNVSLSMIVLCLCTGSFLAALDTSIIITIFNEIGTEFKSSNLSVWIMTSYMLSTSAIQPLCKIAYTDGKLSDIFGRKSTLVAIVCFFLLGSWLCGIANSMVQMGIARAIAGLGGGGIMTMASVVIHDLLPMRRRGQYQSYVNMAQTIGTTVGAPLGGIINDTIGWRYCFYINIPFCVFLLYVYIYKMEDYNLERGVKSTDNIREKFEKIDLVGAGFLLTANISFVTGASLGGNTHDWDHPLIVGLLASAISFFTLFGVYEYNWAKNPLVSRTLIKNRNTVAVCLNNFFLCNSTMAFTYLTPQFFMGVLGYNASSAGLWVLPRTFMVAVGCWVAGRYLAVKGRYKYFVVTLVAVHVITSFGMASWNPKSPIWFLLSCMNVEGFIFGSVFVATMVALVANIAHADTASATSMIFLCRSTGWLSGSTITAAIMQYQFKNNLYKEIKGPEAAEIIEFVRTSITKVRTLAPEVQAVIVASLQKSIHTAFKYGVAASICCFLITLTLRNCKLGG
ncbi:MFS multidrug transporter [Mucor ambiguus]|uniref:MFS multidrug transporter n=1 Tax=Mucor ambiguus TaxID=91626 RepID=A0A0C9LTG4_9FUNG|nr:MFS multidrug transporter [Mucor ambiguus]